MAAKKMKKEIQKICRQYNKTEPHDFDSSWEGLDLLQPPFTSHQVKEAFEKFMADNRYSSVDRPLAAFVKASRQYLKEEFDEGTGAPATFQQINDDAEVDALCADLCLIGNGNPFTGKWRAMVANLRKSATDEEIKAAFTEFTFEYEDKDLKFAVMKFAEGGGKDIIAVIRKRTQLLKEQAELQAKLTEDFVKQRAAEVAAADLDEDDVTEIILPGAPNAK